MLPRLVVVKSHGVVLGNQANKYIMTYSYNIYYICVFTIPSYACTFMLKIAVASSKNTRSMLMHFDSDALFHGC